VAYAGQTISNPVTGERITFLRTSSGTGGKFVLFDCVVRPDGIPLPPHIHTQQTERFEVLNGRLGVMLGGKEHVLTAGERIALPPRVKHQWWNAGEEEVHFRVEVTPAHNLEAVLEAMCGMANEGRLNGAAMPTNPFLLANIGKLGETYLPVVPIWMQQVGLTMGSMLGRVLGYDPAFCQYRATAPEPVDFALDLIEAEQVVA
jgi:mannose-6-phosphate isomerase-like protein (cupin superfamily)